MNSISNRVDDFAEMKRKRRMFRLPEPLDGETHFTWGPVVKLHKIPELNIVVIEYKSRIHVNGGGTDSFEDESTFHLHSTNSSFNTLEAAIIFGIAKFNNAPVDFARAACKLLEKAPAKKV